MAFFNSFVLRAPCFVASLLILSGGFDFWCFAFLISQLCVSVFGYFSYFVWKMFFVFFFSLRPCKPPSNSAVFVFSHMLYYVHRYICIYIYIHKSICTRLCATVKVCEMCICSGGHTHSTSSVAIDANEECTRVRERGCKCEGLGKGRKRETA